MAEYDETRVWTSISDCLIQNRCWICLTPFRRGKTRKVFMMQDIVDHFEKRRQFKELVDSTLAADAAAAAASSANVTAPADDATNSSEPAKTAEAATSSTEISTATAAAPATAAAASVAAVEATESDATAAPAASNEAAATSAAADPQQQQVQSGQHHVVPSFSTSDVEAVEGFVHMKRTWERYLKLMEGGGEKAQARLTKELKDCDVDLWMSGLACCNSTLCSAVYKCLKPPADGEEEAGAAGGKKSKVRNYIANMKNCPPGCGCDNPWPFMGNNVVSESSTTASINMPPVGQQPPASVSDDAGAAPPFPLKAPSEAAPTAPAAAAPAPAAPMVGMFGKPMVRQKKA